MHPHSIFISLIAKRSRHDNGSSCSLPYSHSPNASMDRALQRLCYQSGGIFTTQVGSSTGSSIKQSAPGGTRPIQRLSGQLA